jgi:sugar phosphate isomerase/epimerase
VDGRCGLAAIAPVAAWNVRARHGLRDTPDNNGVRRVFVAVSTRSFPEVPFADACAQIADLEFDKLELWLDRSGEHLRPGDVSADPEGFIARYREATRLPCVAFALSEGADPTTFAGLAKAAKLLRVTQITIPAAPLGTPFNAEIERLRELAQTASRDGVRLSIRTSAGALTEDAHTAVELCQAVPGLGLSLDPGLYLRRPASERAQELVYEHTFHAHLRDSTAEQFQVPVGLGQVDYSKLISQLRRTRYDRALSIELWPEYFDGAQRPLELRKMRMLIESLL